MNYRSGIGIIVPILVTAGLVTAAPSRAADGSSDLQVQSGRADNRPRLQSVNATLNPGNALMIDFDVTVSKPAGVSITSFDPLEPEFVVSRPSDVGVVATRL